MPQIDVLPHADICPEGKTFERDAGVSICDNLLEQGIDDRARLREVVRVHDVPRDRARRLRLAVRGRPRTRTTCSTAPGDLSRISRLSCQAIVADEELVVEIPRYTINHAKESK